MSKLYRILFYLYNRTMSNLKDKLELLPKKPGVYLFKNNTGEVIYVGKAKNLKSKFLNNK